MDKIDFNRIIKYLPVAFVISGKILYGKMEQRLKQMDLLYIVDDEEDMLQSMEFYFKKTGYEVQTFTKSKDMMEALEIRKPDLILMDVNLRRNDGRTICKVIKRKYDMATPIILISGNPDLETEYKACNADGFISKPFSLEDVSKMVAAHLQN